MSFELRVAGTGTVAPFLNPATGQSEALVISGGQVVYLQREPLSEAGWNLSGLAPGYLALATANSRDACVVGTDASFGRNPVGVWQQRAGPSLPYPPAPMGICEVQRVTTG